MKNVNSDIAYDFIRKRILSGEYPPGHPLMTNVLSTEIGVSRTPVRDALRQLEVDGLVSIQPRVGASVKEMGIKEFRELCGLRLALESYAAGLAAQNRTEIELQEIEHAFGTMHELTQEIVKRGQQGDMLSELVRADVRFHIAIMTAAKNDLMKKEILRLHLINRVVSGQPRKPVAAQDEAQKARRLKVLTSHEEILSAIRDRNVPLAKETMAEHLQEMVDHHVKTAAHGLDHIEVKELTEEELQYTA